MANETARIPLDQLEALRQRCESVDTVAEKARMVVESLAAQIDVDVAIMRRRRGAWLNLVAAAGIAPHELPPAVPASEGMAGRMVREGRTIHIEDVSRDDLTRNLHASAREGEERRSLIFRSCVATPLKVGTRVVGTMGVYSIWEHRRFSPDDIAYLEAAASFLAEVVSIDDKKNDSACSSGVFRLDRSAG